MAALVAGCTQVRLFPRFFLTPCPAAGPVRETELTLHLEPVAAQASYDALAPAAAGLPRRSVARVTYDGREFPIEHVGPAGTPGGRRLLVVAGVHGNEIAGSLAAPRILDDVRARPDAYAGVELHVLAPANPVGLANLSRYNAAGCDVNRDFGRFRTPEAVAIRTVLTSVAPELVVSLHEGPQDGFYVIATRRAPVPVARAMTHAVEAEGIALATKTFLGVPMAGRGLDHEGRFVTAVKRLIGVGSLGAYAQVRGIGVLTTESPWGSTRLDERIAAQVVAVRAAARALAETPPPEETPPAASDRQP